LIVPAVLAVLDVLARLFLPSRLPGDRIGRREPFSRIYDRISRNARRYRDAIVRNPKMATPKTSILVADLPP
jgi:hypothetical protein